MNAKTSIARTHKRSVLRLAVSVAAFGLGGALVGCESYDNGTTRTKSTRVEETPHEKTTTTTTTERKVEDAPR